MKEGCADKPQDGSLSGDGLPWESEKAGDVYDKSVLPLTSPQLTILLVEKHTYFIFTAHDPHEANVAPHKEGKCLIFNGPEDDTGF